jgi:hypothetical protein
VRDPWFRSRDPWFRSAATADRGESREGRFGAPAAAEERAQMLPIEFPDDNLPAGAGAEAD